MNESVAFTVDSPVSDARIVGILVPRSEAPTKVSVVDDDGEDDGDAAFTGLRGFGRWQTRPSRAFQVQKRSSRMTQPVVQRAATCLHGETYYVQRTVFDYQAPTVPFRRRNKINGRGRERLIPRASLELRWCADGKLNEYYSRCSTLSMGRFFSRLLPPPPYAYILLC